MLRHALDGLTVVDFTQIGAGPTCTMLLADMGARVVKVESPGGELGRSLGPGWIGEDAALYHGFNRNKLGASLDLKTQGGVAVARRLVAGADIVVESMRPGVMSRLGLGFETLAGEHPGLIYCSISAYGQTGPYAQRAGVDGIVQADSGLMSLIGLEGAEPCKVQAPIVDVMTGYVAVMAVLAKLAQRARDGQGGQLDVSLLNAALALQQSSITSFLADAQLPVRVGSAAPYSAPNQAFETRDGWLMIAAYMPERWTRLCALLGLPALATDRRFATSPLRVANRLAMVEILTEALKTRTTGEWLPLLRAADILCARVASYEDLAQHPQLEANGMLAQVEHPVHGTIRMPGFPVDSAQANAQPHRPAPSCGEHTRQVLRESGFDDAEIATLLRAGAIRCPDAGDQASAPALAAS
ncbi:CaiB/BaiF CoA transferase family protein [Variovorax sp. RA8]|uniref:CaiB/BaiF CoA transferase family protein n=1 Tax=Variovorax sp. (strain JCM 16519 / RA8) TaxID=662548 RepID=UPI00131645B2|nr:CoA transferase [Variovorax sp. RA8]VTU20331.1 Formyl-coenzyme A transferase [Variovorax sp. RA8]